MKGRFAVIGLGRLEAAGVVEILTRPKEPLVVHATAGLLTTNYQYLTSYKGLAFFTKATVPLNLPRGTELVYAKSIWVPGA